MPTATRPPLSIEKSFPSQWRWNVEQSKFSGDSSLIQLLGHSHERSFGVEQFFSYFKRSLVNHVKDLMLQVYLDGVSRELRSIVYIDDCRHLVFLYIEKDEGSKSSISGTFEILSRLPSKAREIELIGISFHSIKEGIVISDADHRILMVNPAFCEDTGYDAQALLGEKTSILKTEQSGLDFFETMWDTAKKEGFWQGVLTTKNAQGEASARYLTLYYHDKGEPFYVSVSRDMVESQSYLLAKENSDEIDSQFVHIKTIHEAIEKSYRTIKSAQTLVGFTLDAYFKGGGNYTSKRRVLQHLLQPLLGTVRFSMLSANVVTGFFVCEQNVHVIHAKLEQMLSLLNKSDLELVKGVTISVNIGCSILGVDARSLKQVISYSGQALLSKRIPGENVIVYHDSRVQRLVDEKKRLTQDVKESLEQNNIEVFYQPIVDLASLKVVKFEALLRMGNQPKKNSKTRMMIKIAEEQGWIDQFDFLVEKRALAELPMLQQHFDNKQLQLAINRSLANDRAAQSSLAQSFELITQSKINPKLVTIELLGTNLFDADGKLNDSIEEMKSKQVKLTVNDFYGCGLPLTYLSSDAFDEVKIDMLKFSGFQRSSKEYAMLDAITRAAHKIGLVVAVCGVEHIDSLKLLRELGVDYVQGDLLGAPQTLQQILKQEAQSSYPQFRKQLEQKKTITAKDVMTADALRISMDEKLSKAKALLKRTPESFLLVVENSRCQGLLFRADLYEALSPYVGTEAELPRDVATLNRRVHQVMTKDISTIDSVAPMSQILTQIKSAPSRILVVVGENGVCLGTISSFELLGI
jgi:PAS domain S-box-containing protein